MNINPLAPGGGESPRLAVVLLVAAVAVVSAHSEAWASAMGTAAAVYTVVSTNQDRRS